MPRPKLKSDEEVLSAARAALRRHGPARLTLQDVATEVGLSRAALIQRFTDRDTLLLRVMQQAVTDTRAHLDAMPLAEGPEALRAFLDALVDVLGAGERFSVDVLSVGYESEHPALRALAEERLRLVCAAIAQRLPPGAPPRAPELLHAIIAGATMQWGVLRQGRLDDFVRARLRDALALIA